MGQVRHGSATTTAAVRRAIQHSQESLRALARRYGVNPKTIAKWKARKSVADLRTGPKEPRSTVLTVEEEAVAVTFRRHTCRHSTTASTPCSRPSRIWPARRDIVALSVMESLGCRRSKAKPRPSVSSRPIRSAIFTSTLPRFGPLRASFISSSPSTGPRSSPSSNCMRR
jgi:transposase-like protein